MKATPNQFNTLGGEREIELEVPLGLDRIVYKTKRKPKPEPNYTRVQALLLLGMIVIVWIAGVVV